MGCGESPQKPDKTWDFFWTSVRCLLRSIFGFLDDEIIDGEVRHTAVGMMTAWQLLYIIYVWRGDNIRLISARFAIVRERKIYENR